MQTEIENTKPSIPNFPGIVIDPESGRACALQADIFRALGLAGNQVRATGARIYHGRYWDIEDVLAGRARTRPKGRPRGMILTELASILAATVVGAGVAAGILATRASQTADTLRGAVNHQEQDVRMMEELGITGAAEARAQWETTKPIAFAGIANLETLKIENQ